MEETQRKKWHSKRLHYVKIVLQQSYEALPPSTTGGTVTYLLWCMVRTGDVLVSEQAISVPQVGLASAAIRSIVALPTHDLLACLSPESFVLFAYRLKPIADTQGRQQALHSSPLERVFTVNIPFHPTQYSYPIASAACMCATPEEDLLFTCGSGIMKYTVKTGEICTAVCPHSRGVIAVSCNDVFILALQWGRLYDTSGDLVLYKRRTGAALMRLGRLSYTQTLTPRTLVMMLNSSMDDLLFAQEDAVSFSLYDCCRGYVKKGYYIGVPLKGILCRDNETVTVLTDRSVLTVDLDSGLVTEDFRVCPVPKNWAACARLPNDAGLVAFHRSCREHLFTLQPSDLRLTWLSVACFL